MDNICNYCLNYEPKTKKNSTKNKESCSQACFKMSEQEGMMVCENFTLVICPDVSSAVIERFLRKNMNFYDNLCYLASMILSIYAYQSVFKIIFDIENGKIEFVDLTNAQNTYGIYDIKTIELRKGVVSFETDKELKHLLLSVIEPDSLIFVEFKDFAYKYPIKGVFAKPNRFIDKNTLSLMLKSFGGQEVW